MTFAEHIQENYQNVKKVGSLINENGIYTFTVTDRKGGTFSIKEVHEEFVILEDQSSFSTISRVIIPLSRFSVLHNVDKDLLRHKG